jgi:hypothetical protein
MELDGEEGCIHALARKKKRQEEKQKSSADGWPEIWELEISRSDVLKIPPFGKVVCTYT